jgi:GTPase SAR1 family protein
MGSVRRQSEAQSGGHDCNVALVGDCRTGKSALVARFVSGKFTEVRRNEYF